MSDQELIMDDPTAEVEAPAQEVLPEASAADADESGDVGTIFNLQSRQQLSGKVKNITPFGAFIDLGLPQDGLVHISELSRKKVDKVEDVVNVGDEVDVWVKKVDRKRGRISLTMIKPVTRRIKDVEEDEELEGVVTRLESYGAFVDIDSERDGLVHISQITHGFINHPQEALEVGQTVQVKVLKVNRKKRQVDLSIKALLPPPVVETPAEEPAARSRREQQRAEEEVYVPDEEPVPTAMAIAFANLQNQDAGDDKDKSPAVTKESLKKKQEQESLIARTLAANK
ncbi:MAG: Polyribonucleotide nucleotidyltransferase [Anaerolineae bacterium]|nr:Polyribonucleotide nucleotidyltransferase [Anaerolineae bacterium]